MREAWLESPKPRCVLHTQMLSPLTHSKYSVVDLLYGHLPLPEARARVLDYFDRNMADGSPEVGDVRCLRVWPTRLLSSCTNEEAVMSSAQSFFAQS